MLLPRPVQLVLVAALLPLLPACSDEPPPPSPEAAEHKPLSSACASQVVPDLDQGLTLLHHMTYKQALGHFAEAAEKTPDCAMAHWGLAMAHIHPLWSDPPSAEVYQAGQAHLKKARSARHSSPRLDAFIAATGAYYEGDQQASERPHLRAFERGWAAVKERFADDPDALSFYALSLLGTASPDDKEYSQQRQAGALAEAVLERYPDHPGAHHYLIHAYDYPALASKAESVARNYSALAPEVPHALHMPSHILTRLGQWPDVIGYNQRSAKAALDLSGDSEISLHFAHAIDYLVYAHLQRGEDGEADQAAQWLVQHAEKIQPHPASAYALAAVPARLAVEKRDWLAAAGLPLRDPASYPWDKAPAAEAISYFARGLGAAMLGDIAAAEQAQAALASLRDDMADAYWANQADIQHHALSGWIAYASDNPEQALAHLQTAAEMEAATEKHPITPGELLPAQEQLGDLQLALGRYTEAEASYRQSLQRNAQRLHSLVGAATAARLADQPELAEDYYRKVVALMSADSDWSQLAQAREYLQGDSDDGQ